MPITVVCKCGTRFDVPDSYVGRTGNCTSCGAPMQVRPPSGAGAARAPSGAGPVALTAPRSPSGSGVHPDATGSARSTAVTRPLGKYQLTKKLGDAKSTVFLATCDQGQVAVKVLPQKVAERSPEAGKRFLREARALFGMNHPNLIRCLDAGEELGTYYLAMEHFEGRTLAEVLAVKGGRLSEPEALGYGLQVAKGLAFLQEKKLVHRNIKPSHILVGADDAVKLVGMGLVRGAAGSDDVQVTGAGILVGTPQYMSPEQAMADDLSTTSDLYSLGTTIYELLTGETPFHDKVASRVVAKLVKEPPPPVQKKSPEVSNATAAVLEKLLQKDPDDRYQRATDLISDLEAIQAGRLVAGLPPSFTQAAKGGSQPADAGSIKKLVIVVGVLIALVVVLVVVVLALALGGK